MNNYTFEEYCDIHYFYGLANGNAVLAQRLYGEHFPNRQHPNFKTFVAVHNRLKETGTFKRNMVDTGRDRLVRDAQFEENVLQLFDENPSTSTRAVGRELGCGKSTVWRVLNGEGLHPYKLQKVQALNPQDYPRRMEFSRWILRKDIEDPTFLEKVLFTDEASFSREGIFNSRTSHVWAADNPNATFIRGYHEKFAVNVWCGIVGDLLIGPYILQNRLNAPVYLVFLRDILPELLQDVPLHIRNDMWFQHDGAPAHFGNNVRDYLNVTFEQKWVGRGGPVHWPARSPDLTPLDFFLWGHMKELVYSTPVESDMDLVARIAEAAARIQEDIAVFERVRQSLVQRCRLCNRVQGRHFEQLL